MNRTDVGYYLGMLVIGLIDFPLVLRILWPLYMNLFSPSNFDFVGPIIAFVVIYILTLIVTWRWWYAYMRGKGPRKKGRTISINLPF